MDSSSRLLMAGAGGAGGAPTFFNSVIVATIGGAGGGGGYNGTTGTVSQATYAHNAFNSSTSAGWEWQVTSGFGSLSGFVGLMDAAHLNATPNFGGNVGERMMWYVGANTAFGEETGTVIIAGSGAGVTFTSGDTLGLTYNRANGKLSYYKNGSLFVVLQNIATTSLALYPAVSYWFNNVSMATTMLTTQSGFWNNYVLAA